MVKTYDEVIEKLNSGKYDDLKELMSRSDEFDTALLGNNSDGEDVMVSINADNITICTFQNNNWCRTTTYYSDFTIEEGYEKY